MRIPIVLIPALLVAQGAYSWRLLNHAANDCSSSGTFIVGSGTSACLAIDTEQPGLILQSTGDNVRLDFWFDSSCQGASNFNSNSRSCINGAQQAWKALKVINFNSLAEEVANNDTTLP